MMKSSIGAACATVLVALAGGLATPDASHAAIYGGIFDPSNEFYKWSGTHRFEVSDACLLGAPGWRPANTYASDCTAQLTGGTVTVVNKNGPEDYTLDDVSRTLDFVSLGFAPTSTNPGGNGPEVWGLYVDGGEVVGFDTLTFVFRFSGDDESTHGGDWHLSWNSDNIPDGTVYCNLFPGSENCPEEGGGEDGRPSLSALSGGLRSANSHSNSVGFVRLVNFDDFGDQNGNLIEKTDILEFLRLDPTRPVPEPTTVTLVLAALGAGWLARRRKR